MKKIILILLIMATNLIWSQDATPTITVFGEGVVVVVPDQVRISVLVESESDTPAKAKSINDQAMRKVLVFLEGEKLGKGEYQTEEVSLRKERNYSSTKGKDDVYYAARQYLNILLKDIKKYDRIMVGLLDAGVTDISSVRFDYSNKEKIESQVRVKAMEDAFKKAKEYAKAAGIELGKVLMISENLNDRIETPVSFKMVRDEALGASAGGNTIAVGEREFKKEIKVIFGLK